MKNNLLGAFVALLVLIGCGGGTSSTTQTSQNIIPLPVAKTTQTIPTNWYIRIVAEDTTNNMQTAGAQLGQLEASNAVTQHTLAAIAPFTSPFLDVVFINPVGVAAGEYKTNFHRVNTLSDTWDFTVKSSDANATIILSYKGLYTLSPYLDKEGRQQYTEYLSATNPLLTHMKLIDLSTGLAVPVDNNGTTLSYVFNMAGGTDLFNTQNVLIGKSKNFRWVLQSTPVIVPKLSKESTMLHTLHIQALRKDAKATPTALKNKRVQSIDMLAPPKFEVLVK